MAKKQTPSVILLTDKFILSYPKLDVPKPYFNQETQQEQGDPVYSFEAISSLDSLDNWGILEKGASEIVHGNVEKRLVLLAKEAWGDGFNCAESVKHGGLKWPFKYGDAQADAKGEKAAHYRGKKFWRAKALAEIKGSPNEPSLYEASKDGSLIPILKSTETGRRRINDLFYGGAICTAELNCVPYEIGKTVEDPGKKYMTFYVNSVVFEENGERLGGGNNMERMRGIHGGKSQTDPTAGMSTDLPEDVGDDEIPF
jgi:hypothetical protein